MSAQRVPAIRVSYRQGKALRKLRGVLQDQGLVAVLDSLPASESFTFNRTQKFGHNATKLFLGHRPKVNGSICEAWACIISANKDLKLPVVFYDQELSDDGARTFQYPRSASSLLHKAIKLQPPFCFLQHDPHDNAQDVRNMLCAVILYQALASGVDAYALRWDKFEKSLGNALRYIESRATYHQWLHSQKIASLKPAASRKDSKSTAPKENPTAEKPRTASSTSDDDHAGFTVRPSGSDMVLKPNSSLCRLKNQIGDRKFRLLDNIPAIPLRFSPQALGALYFPYRLKVGTYDPGSSDRLGVYAYLTHDGVKKTGLKILSHDNNGQLVWAMNRLKKVDLLEPFNYLNNLTTKSNGAKPGDSARAAKIQSVIFYYFFLAENEGLIRDPHIKVAEALGKRLCTACAELREANLSNDDDSDDNRNDANHDDETDIDTAIHEPSRPVNREVKLAREEESEVRPSCIVTVRLPRNILRDIVKSGPIKYRKGTTNSNPKTKESKPGQEVLALEESLNQDLTQVRLELRLSSQVSHEISRSPPAPPRGDTDGNHKTVPELEALSLDVTNCEHACNSSATVGLDVMRTQYQPVTATQIDDIIYGDGGRAVSYLSSIQVAADRDPSRVEEIPSITVVICNTGNTTQVLSTSDLVQELRPNNARNGSEGSTSMDISSSPLPASNRLHSPAIQVNETEASLESIKLVVSATSNRIRANLVKHVTLERTAQREVEVQPAPSMINRSDILPNVSEVIEISEDEESDDTVLSAIQNKMEQKPEFSNRIGDTSDSTDLSSNPERTKRKSFLISDSDDDLTVSDKHQKVLKKRKKNLLNEGKAKHSPARLGTERSSEITRQAATSRKATLSHPPPRLYSKDGCIERNTGSSKELSPKSKGKAKQTPEVPARSRGEIDLTQDHPSPRGQKRRLVFLDDDGDDDNVDEVAFDEWRRASRNRR